VAESPRLTAADIARRLAALPSDVLAMPTDADVSDERWAYREAVALVGAFDAGTIPPAHGRPDENALRELLTKDCERALTLAGSQWRLLDVVRTATVRRLATPDRLLSALAKTPPNPDDPGRAMAEAYLAEKAPALENQTLEQLHGTLQAITWLAPTDISVPTADEVRGCIALASLLQPLQALVGSHFVGRARELARLADYVEVLPPGSVTGRVTRNLRQVLNLSEKPPLVIHGPGGMGKSTLVAKFVLDHSEVGPPHRFPFAYLTFDRGDLMADEPLTLLAEATRQLRAQYPAMAPLAVDLEGSIRATLVTEGAADAEGAPVRIKQSRGAINLARHDESALISGYASIADMVLAGRELPILWILDTFERANRGPRAVGRLWRFLDQLQGAIPRLRVVFAGRAPIEDRPTEDMRLTGFDQELAVTFLREQLPDLHVTSKLLKAAAGQVGANPLSLKLAAELFRAEGEAGLRKVQTRRRLLFRLGDEEVQGVLYRRVLDHLRDPDLKAIANPGLAVRRVTPDVIAHVLAGPCGLGPVDDVRAGALFEKLTRELSLIEPAGPGTVRHRADVRSAMLPLLERAEPTKVARIHRAAVAYYRRKPGVEAKAEELYHRLALGQSSRVLDKAWDRVAAASLEPALDELPPAGRVYLANRLGRTLDVDVITAADDEAWGQQASRLAREYLESGRPSEALAVVRQRQDRHVPLAIASIEIEALATLGRVDEALALVERAEVRATDEVQPEAFVQVAVIGARIAEDVGLFDQALKRLAEARDAANAIGDKILHVAAGAAALRLHRRSGTANSAKAKRLRSSVVEEARGLSRGDRVRNPSLVRDLAAEIGDDAPEIVADAAKLIGIDVEGDAGGILDDLLSHDQVDQFDEFVRERVEPTDESQMGLGRLSGRTTTEQGQHVSDFLMTRAGGEAPWTAAVSQVYQADADRPAFAL